MWAAIIPGAIKGAGSVLSASTSKAATEDARAAEAAGLGLDIYGLAEVFRRGSFLGRSTASWSGAKKGTQDARQFFRVTAAAVGAIDGGYRQRGDGGNAAALSAAEQYATGVDRTLGTALASEVRTQNPAGFISKVSAIQPPAGAPAPVIPPAVGAAPGAAPGAAAQGWTVGGSLHLGASRGLAGGPWLWVGAGAFALILLALLIGGRK